MKKVASLLFVLLFGATLSIAQVSFSPLNSPNGGQIVDFEINQFGQILAFQAHRGIYFSNDFGNNWDKTNSQVIITDRVNRNEIKTHPNGSFYLKASNNLYKFGSINLNFRSIYQSSTDIEDFVIDEAGTIFLLDKKLNIYRSEDDGDSWVLISNSRVPNLAGSSTLTLFAPKGVDFIYANLRTDDLPENRLYQVSKNNSTKKLVEDFESSARYICGHPSGDILISNGSEIFITSDGLTEKNSVSPPDGEFFYNMICRENGEVIGINKFGFYKSNDLGQSWQLITPIPYEQSGIPKRLEYSVADDSYYSLHSTGGSYNLFKMATDFSTGIPIIPDETGITTQEIKVNSKGIGFVKVGYISGALTPSPNILHQSPADWYRLNHPTSPFKLQVKNRLGVKFLAIAENDYLFAIAENDSLYRSRDDGSTWETFQKVPFKRLETFYNRYSYLKSGPNRVLIFSQEAENGEDVLHLSRDNGESWIQIDTNLVLPKNIMSKRTGDVFIFKGGRGTATIPNKHFCKWNVNSLTWDTLYSDPISLEGYISKAQRILLTGTENGNPIHIEYDPDGNHTFYSAPSKNHNIYSASNGYLFLKNSLNELFISKNFGLSWTSIHTSSKTIVSVEIDQSNRIWIGYAGSGVYRSNKLIFEDNFIAGKVFRDDDENCLYDSTELVFPGQIAVAEGSETFYSNTNSKGEFIIAVPPGDYNLSVAVNEDLWEPCTPVIPVSFVGALDWAIEDYPLKKKKDCSELNVQLATAFLRRCFPNNYYVFYSNTGSRDADSAYVEIDLDPRFTITTSDLPFQNTGIGKYVFDIGKVDIFESDRFYFETEMQCDSVNLGESICAIANIFPQQTCSDTSTMWSGASLDIDGTCDGDSIRFKIKNIGAGDMLQARSHIIIEDVAIMRVGNPFQLGAGEEFAVPPILAEGQTVHIEVPQPEGHPGNSKPSLTIEGCGSTPHTLGLFNQFGHDDDNPFLDIECQEVIGSYDPNDKSAVPTGWDVQHKIQPNRSIEYLIRFQNTGTDTAFTVRVQDSISHYLDVTSFQAGPSSHPYEYTISGQGVVNFTFNNIMLPDSNINEAASNGFVKYKIAMKTDLPIGTEILNEADIFFDFNPPIRTNETFHLVDEPWVLVKTSEVFLPETEVKIYPNPFNESAILELKSDSFKSEFNCRLLDLNGKVISSQTSNNQKITLTRNNLNSGIYFYQLIGKSGKIASGKVVIK